MAERLASVDATLRRTILERVGAGNDALAARTRELHRAADSRLERLEMELARRAAETDARSPLRALARGYAVVTSPEGRIIRDPAEAPAGSPLRMRLAAGGLLARSEGPDPDYPTDDG